MCVQAGLARGTIITCFALLKALNLDGQLGECIGWLAPTMGALRRRGYYKTGGLGPQPGDTSIDLRRTLYVRSPGTEPVPSRGSLGVPLAFW